MLDQNCPWFIVIVIAGSPELSLRVEGELVGGWVGCTRRASSETGRETPAPTDEAQIQSQSRVEARAPPTVSVSRVYPNARSGMVR